MHNQNKKGFTLVELLVVVAIIGLLSTIAVVSLGSARQKSRDAKRVADMKQVSTALEQFYSDKGGYPAFTAVTSTYAIGGNVLCDAGTRSATTDLGSTSCTGTAYTTVPVYPLPGKNVTALGTCPTGAASFAAIANTSAVANYCYADDTAYAATAYGTTYKMLWQLEATNASYNGSNCMTSPSGVVCS